VASRGLPENDYFFQGMQRNALLGCKIDETFKYTDSGEYYRKSFKKLNCHDFDMVLMRLPRPIEDDFLLWVEEVFSHAVIINKPSGIIATSSKKYLVNFPEVCPDIRVCYSVEDVKEEISKFPIVLKPLKEYGGKGLLKINGNTTDDGSNKYNTDDYLNTIKDAIENEGYLSMKFLKNVTEGDKRILVVGGEILASSLRLPAEDSWLCNIAQGGKSVSSDVTEREREIIKIISPTLEKKGVLIYGADTLVDDDGNRVLSEVNTLSVGGFPQAEAQTGKPVIKNLLRKIFEYAEARNR
jgi:glutathione synthase